jgi:hypothetical protein
MVDIFIPSRKIDCKDCLDWIPLQDGTLTGDPKYCDRSLFCKQLGMRSDYYGFRDIATGEYKFDYFCTGMYVGKDEIDDQEVS